MSPSRCCGALLLQSTDYYCCRRARETSMSCSILSHRSSSLWCEVKRPIFLPSYVSCLFLYMLSAHIISFNFTRRRQNTRASLDFVHNSLWRRPGIWFVIEEIRDANNGTYDRQMESKVTFCMRNWICELFVLITSHKYQSSGPKFLKS